MAGGSGRHLVDDRASQDAPRLRAVSPAPEQRDSGYGQVVRLQQAGSPPRSRSQLISMVRHVIEECAAQAGKDAPALSEDAVRYLCARWWTYEQFTACVRRAVAANAGSLITAADLGEV